MGRRDVGVAYSVALTASSDGIGATGVEFAARRWIDGAGNIALKNDPLGFDGDIGNGNGREQRFGVGMHGAVEHFGFGADFNDVAQIHDSDSIAAVADDAEVVGDE